MLRMAITWFSAVSMEEYVVIPVVPAVLEKTTAYHMEKLDIF